MNGTIFDIKECSMHDGPGVRVTVFLKGCSLGCMWCHNPEGLSREPQLMFKENRCCRCGKCRVKCNHDICQRFHRCVYACPNDCLSVSGKTMDDAELAESLLKQKNMLQFLNGGVTFSGGEPLLQWEFVCAVIDRISELNIAIQTSGFAESDVYRSVIDRADFVMQDIKIMNPEKHKLYTGVENSKILANIDYLKKSGKEFVFRVPLIPDITDTEENLKEISKFVGGHRTELMRYNTFAGAKYPMLGMKYKLADRENRKDDYTKYFENAVLL